MGLLTHVVSEDDLGSTVNELIEKLFNRPIRAYGGIKSLLVDTLTVELKHKWNWKAVQSLKQVVVLKRRKGWLLF